MSRTIVLTGGTQGFGRLFTQTCRPDERLIIPVRNMKARKGQLDEIQQACPANIDWVEMDLGSHQARVEGIEQILKLTAASGIDVLVHNAGYGVLGPFEDISESQLKEIHEVNFHAVVHLTKRLLPAVRQQQGKIVTLSSIAGLSGFPFYSVYCATKYALEGFWESLWYELRPLGVQVALVEPGAYATNFNNSSQAQMQLFEGSNNLYQKRFTQFKSFLAKKEHTVAQDPQEVVRLLRRLIDQEGQIKFRHVIGKDAKSIYLLKRLLPDRWRMGLIQLVMDRMMRKA